LVGESIEGVDEFKYLGSLVATTGMMDSDGLQKASKAFGALRKAVFLDKSSSRRQYMMLVFYLCCYVVQSAGLL